MKMDNDDLDDAEFLKALEESKRFFAEIEAPMRKNVPESKLPSTTITLDDTSEPEEVDNIHADPGIFSGKEAEGFDLSAAGEWIYPTNYPIREYQKKIVTKALFNNTLVSLPTGLGKTFIAAVVMYNYHRWYPKNKIVFMAHSKPLVSQQVTACCDIMGISRNITAELNGNMHFTNRKLHWESKKIFFLTPQVFANDLAKELVKPDSIRCLVVDEAHKALGNQAYCQVIHSIKPFSNLFRVLALSATPGDNMNMVKQVIENLMISHLEIWNEENPDVKPYLHQKKVEVVQVKLDDKILEIKNKALDVIGKYVRPLVNMKVVHQSFSNMSSFSLIMKQKEFLQDNSVAPAQRGLALSNFSVAINLFQALEELQIHGLRSFLNKLLSMQAGVGAKNNVHLRLANDEGFKVLLQDLEDYLGPNKDISFDPNASLVRLLDDLDTHVPDPIVVYSHPKFKVLEEIITDHFQQFKESTRVIIFCKSRPCTGEICNFLLRFRPLIKPMIFIGQSQTTTGTTTKGFNQATQLTVMKKFREGAYNTLIATCVAEEGLDIGEVDLIVNFDATKNSNTQVQRSGRTGRKRDGRVVTLVTEGKEYRDYNESISKSKTMNKKLGGDLKNLPLYPNNPRLLPENVNPICQEMNLKSAPNEPAPEPTTSKKKQKTKDPDTKKTGKKPATKRKKKEEKNSEDKEITDSDVPSSQAKTNKYDIRYAMQKAMEKNKSSQSSHNDSSGSLFESVGVVDLLRDTKKKKLKTKNNFGKKNLINRIFSQNKKIEIIELDNSKKFDGVLYNDDLEESESDEILKFLNDFKSVKKFLDENEIPKTSKTEFSELINLEKISEYLCPDIENVELLDELRKVHNYLLSLEDLDLKEEDMEELIFNSQVKSQDYLRSSTPKDKFVNKRRGYGFFERGTTALFESKSKNEVKDELEEILEDDFMSPVERISPKEKEVKALAWGTAVTYTVNFENEAENALKKITTDDIVSPVAPISLDRKELRFLEECTAEPSDSNLKNCAKDEFEELVLDDFMTPLAVSNNVVTKKRESSSLAGCTTVPFDTNLKNPLKDELEGITVDDFMSPMAQISPLKKVMASSTPLKVIEEETAKEVEKPIVSLPTVDFNLWDDDDFFIDKNIEKKISPKRNFTIIDPTMITISQAMNMVDQYETQKPEEKSVKNPPITSPVFLSQKRRKTPPKEPVFLLSGSPILSQKTKKKSKKSLKFEEIQEKPSVITTEPASEEDIFLEAEREMEMQKSQKLPDIPEEEILTQATIIYDLDETQINFKDLTKINEEKILAEESHQSWGQLTNTSSNKENLKFEKSQNPPTAIVRPLGFEDYDDNSQWLSKNPQPKKNSIQKWLNKSEKNSKFNYLEKSEKKKNQFTPNFNCFDDDFFDVQIDDKTKEKSDDSDDCFNVFKKKNKMRLNESESTVESKNKSDLMKDDVFDGDLSDGALEAIKAVEEFEKSEKVVSRKEMPSTSRVGGERKNKVDFSLWDSDDSDEFFKPGKAVRSLAFGSKRKKDETIDLTKDSGDKRKLKKGKKKSQEGPFPKNDFIELEAQLSDDHKASSDEENTSGLDEYDSSFVDERENLTQAPNVDMTAKYLQTVKSPVNKNAGFKIPKPKPLVDFNVFSQVPETEVGYQNDSFCVDEIDEYDDNEMSALELAELILERRKKRKKRKRLEEPAPENRKNKHRRILKIESESSDDDIAVIEPKTNRSAQIKTNDSKVSEKTVPSRTLEEKIVPNRTTQEKVVPNRTPQSNKSQTVPKRTSEKVPSSSKKQSNKQIVFISAKQLASALEITTALRAKYNVHAIIRSFLGADYIVSWRTGINRITLSDFANGSPAAKTSLKESTQTLRSFFINPIYIVEDDRNKGLPLTVGSHTTMWTKHSYETLAKFFQADIKMIFSRNRDDTARIIALYIKEECENGNGINIHGADIAPRIENKLKFYTSLPGINLAKALRISQKFPSIASFINCCDSPDIIAREMEVDRTQAIRIYQTLCNIPFT